VQAGLQGRDKVKAAVVKPKGIWCGGKVGRVEALEKGRGEFSKVPLVGRRLGG